MGIPLHTHTHTHTPKIPQFISVLAEVDLKASEFNIDLVAKSQLIFRSIIAWCSIKWNTTPLNACSLLLQEYAFCLETNSRYICASWSTYCTWLDSHMLINECYLHLFCFRLINAAMECFWQDWTLEWKWCQAYRFATSYIRFCRIARWYVSAPQAFT